MKRYALPAALAVTLLGLVTAGLVATQAQTPVPAVSATPSASATAAVVPTSLPTAVSTPAATATASPSPVPSVRPVTPTPTVPPVETPTATPRTVTAPPPPPRSAHYDGSATVLEILSPRLIKVKLRLYGANPDWTTAEVNVRWDEQTGFIRGKTVETHLDQTGQRRIVVGGGIGLKLKAGSYDPATGSYYALELI